MTNCGDEDDIPMDVIWWAIVLVAVIVIALVAGIAYMVGTI